MRLVTCENFRISMCRQLRFSCEEISNLADKISQMINEYLYNFYTFKFFFKKTKINLNKLTKIYYLKVLTRISKK